MSEIIGLRFKRNKYGPSIWEDRVSEIIYKKVYGTSPRISKKNFEEYLKNLEKFRNRPFKLVPHVLGKNTLKEYSFDEIIFYND